MPNYMFLILIILFGIFSDYNMKFCPKVYKVTKYDGMTAEHRSDKLYFEDTVQKMEYCCNSILQCDVQKRAELNSHIIEEDIRHCECENKFSECLSIKDEPPIWSFKNVYFKKTAKCYSVDHPIIKCEQYKCYLQPDATYSQYPSKHTSKAVRCAKYELDESKPKIYQTFDLPFDYQGWDEYNYSILRSDALWYDGFYSD